MQVNCVAMPNKGYPTRLKKTLKIPLKFQPKVHRFFKSETWMTNLRRGSFREKCAVDYTVELTFNMRVYMVWLRRKWNRGYMLPSIKRILLQVAVCAVHDMRSG